MDPSLSKAMLCLLEYLKVGALFLIIIRCGGIANSSFLFRCLIFFLLWLPKDDFLSSLLVDLDIYTLFTHVYLKRKGNILYYRIDHNSSG